MKHFEVNLLDSIQKQPEIESHFKEEKKRGRPFFYFSLIILLAVSLFFFNTVSGSNEVFFSLARLPIIREITYLINFYNPSLKGEKEDRINILILGIGGENHQGPYLADTIILASLKPTTKKIALLSVPRDLYAPIKNFGWRKINAANALGMSNSGDGAKLTAEVVSDVFELPVHYYFRVDFQLFKEIIDTLGGIEIDVERSFKDYQFPGPNFSYRVVSFEAGRQTMNGEKALQYVRSRHGTNGESSDFARSRRQQKIILAIKEKLVKEEIIKNPIELFKLYNLLTAKVEANLKIGEIVKLGEIFLGVSSDEIITQTLTAEANGLLKSEIGIDGAYLLKPKNGNFEELANLAQNIFNL